tara:strand:- start:24330 stop:25271 length:942 start_codon:yes stop_codon:yes gene_type:complete
MSILTSSCTTSPGNTGTPNCQTLFKTQSGMFLVPMIANDGTANQIDVTATLNQAYFDALVNHDDASKRWYPIHQTKNVSSVRDASIKEAMDDGTSYVVEKGPRNVELLIPKRSNVFLSKLEQWEGRQFGIVIIDTDGNIKMEASDDLAFLKPIKVQDGTWDATMLDATSTTVSKISLKFQIDKNVKDSMLYMILASEMDNIDLSDIDGLYDVNATYNTPTTTVWIATITTDYGTGITKTPVSGLVTADFTVTEVSPVLGASHSLTSVVETGGSGTGVYTFTLASAATSGDLLHIKTSTIKKYDSSSMANVLIP